MNDVYMSYIDCGQSVLEVGEGIIELTLQLEYILVRDKWYFL